MDRPFEAAHKIMKNIRRILTIAGVILALSVSVWTQTSLPSLNGDNVDVQAQKGKVVVLAIGASWLPLSGKQAEFTNQLVRKYSGKNVAVYFIATDSTNPKSKTYATDE